MYLDQLLRNKEMEKQLYRSQTKKVIAGVSGGLGDYFKIDPVIIRALFIILTLVWGVGIPAYIVMWIIVPKEPINLRYKDRESYSTETEINEEKEGHDYRSKNTPVNHPPQGQGTFIIAVILIVLGSIFLLDDIFSWLSFNYIWPSALIIIGAYLLLKPSFFDKKQKENL